MQQANNTPTIKQVVHFINYFLSNVGVVFVAVPSRNSLELIGDCCDAAIFRILRSVTSLWNWLRNVMIHLCFVTSAAKLRKNSE